MKRQEERRLRYLMSVIYPPKLFDGKYNPMLRKHVEQYKAEKQFRPIEQMERAAELFALIDKSGMSEEEMFRRWTAEYAKHKIVWPGMFRWSSGYNHMPKQPRQDNKTYINYGSGGSNRSKIRFPRKVRKTAWKRFYRLFPKLDPKNQETN